MDTWEWLWFSFRIHQSITAKSPSAQHATAQMWSSAAGSDLTAVPDTNWTEAGRRQLDSAMTQSNVWMDGCSALRYTAPLLCLRWTSPFCDFSFIRFHSNVRVLWKLSCCHLNDVFSPVTVGSGVWTCMEGPFIHFLILCRSLDWILHQRSHLRQVSSGGGCNSPP